MSKEARQRAERIRLQNQIESLEALHRNLLIEVWEVRRREMDRDYAYGSDAVWATLRRVDRRAWLRALRSLIHDVLSVSDAFGGKLSELVAGDLAEDSLLQRISQAADQRDQSAWRWVLRLSPDRIASLAGIVDQLAEKVRRSKSAVGIQSEPAASASEPAPPRKRPRKGGWQETLKSILDGLAVERKAAFAEDVRGRLIELGCSKSRAYALVNKAGLRTRKTDASDAMQRAAPIPPERLEIVLDSIAKTRHDSSERNGQR